LLLLASCTGPLGSTPAGTLDASGGGNGDAGGTWTSHFSVRSAPWRFAFSFDCRHAAGWSFDVTLERMYPKAYYQPVPLDLGWSQGQGPAGATVDQTIRQPGEFWFIVRASSGCSWRVRAPYPVGAG